MLVTGSFGSAGPLPAAVTKIRLGELLRSANLSAMNTPEKSTRRDLGERLLKLWKSPAVEQAKKAAATYLATVLARRMRRGAAGTPRSSGARAG
jgi:hypothetical protein